MLELLLEFLKTQQDWLPSYIYSSILLVIFLFVILYFIVLYLLFPTSKILYKYWLKFSRLLDIPEQFSSNGGSTLRDVIDKIRLDLVDLKYNMLISNGEIKAVMSFLGETNPKLIFWEADSNGEWISISNKWLELTSLDIRNSLGFGWLNAICEDYRDKVLELWLDSVKQKREIHSEFNIYNYLTDKEISVECHSIVIRDINNLPIRYIGIIIPK